MATQHFILEGKWLGARQIPDNRVIPGLDIVRHRSLAFFCPSCGEVWGRVVHEGSEYTQVWQRWCPKHGDGRLASLPYNLLGEPNNLAEDWPLAALTHEFLCELSYLENRHVAIPQA